MVVSDNLKSGIAKACFYEPGTNRTYAEMAAHRPYLDPVNTTRTASSSPSNRSSTMLPPF